MLAKMISGSAAHTKSCVASEEGRCWPAEGRGHHCGGMPEADRVHVATMIEIAENQQKIVG
jgi:hypothetical protein